MAAAGNITCPICDRVNPRDARRCKSCGADFEDPELAAQIGRPIGGAPADDEEINLASDRFLGIRWLGLEVGGDLRLLALLGGIAFALAFVIPVNLDFSGVKATWSVLSKGPTFALLLPAIAAAIGIALFTPLGRLLPSQVLAGIMTITGFLVLLFALAPLGYAAALPERTPWLVWIGIPVAAAGVAVRVMKPRDPHVRWLVVGGAVLVIVGMIIPQTNAGPSLPGEYRIYLHDRKLVDDSLLTASLDGFEHDVMIRFLSMWHMFGIALAVAAAGLCMITPKGPWDTYGLVLRPIGFALVFYIPITFLLYMLNIMGWKGAEVIVWKDDWYKWDDFSAALFAGRARTALVAFPAAVWVVAGLTSLWATQVQPRLPQKA